MPVITEPKIFTTDADAFTFVADARDGLHHLLLVEASTIGRPEPLRPVYVMSIASAAGFEAAAAWVGERRDQWQTWGAMGRVSHQLVADHIAALIRAEPMDPVPHADIVDLRGDDRTVVLSELMLGHDGRQTFREVWQRTYRSAAAARRVHDWLSSRDCPRADLAMAVRGGERAEVDRSIERATGIASKL